MSNYFGQVEILNLSSAYSGWLCEVESLLNEVDDKELIRRAVPSLKITHLLQRLRKLKYCCLVSRITMEETKSNFSPVKGGLYWPIIETESGQERYGPFEVERFRPWKGEIPSDPYFDDKYSEAQFEPPIYGEESELDRFESNHAFDKTSMQMHDLAKKVAEAEPFYGAQTQNNAETVAVVVDCYGMYVPSLMNWLKRMCMNNNYNSTRTMVDLLEKLKNGSDSDGPAILLSPECIKTIYHMIALSSEKYIRDKFDLSSNLDLLFLKMTLLHEIGHHVYLSPTKNISEALANWFLYGFLKPDERILLHAKTLHQSKPYRFYEGILSLLYPNHHSTVFPGVTFPWPIPTGREIVDGLEISVFNQDLQIGYSLDSPPWNKMLNWIDVGFKIISDIYSDLFKYHKKPWEMQFHPAQWLGYALLREILWPDGDKLSGVMKAIEKNNTSAVLFRPLDRKKQKEWLLNKYNINERYY